MSVESAYSQDVIIEYLALIGRYAGGGGAGILNLIKVPGLKTGSGLTESYWWKLKDKDVYLWLHTKTQNPTPRWVIKLETPSSNFWEGSNFWEVGFYGKTITFEEVLKHLFPLKMVMTAEIQNPEGVVIIHDPLDELEFDFDNEFEEDEPG